MIRAVVGGEPRCAQVLESQVDVGDDCQVWIAYSPTEHLGCVFQMVGPRLHKSPGKESKELAGRISQALRDALGGTGRIRPPSISDLGLREHLDDRLPSTLVYLPPDQEDYLESRGGALLAASAIYTGMENWRLWLVGKDTRMSSTLHLHR